MAVSIQQIQQQPSGLDKFLSRLGGVAQIASSGFDLYNAPLKRRLAQAQLDQATEETKLMPEKFAQEQKRADATDKLTNLSIAEKEETAKEKALSAPIDRKAKALGITKLEADIAKSNKELTATSDPKAKLAKLSAEAQNKVGGIADALASLDQIRDAMSKGVGPSRINPNTPGIGTFVSDNQFTSAQRTLDEAVGRLQSGGVIGKEEIVTFREMGPRPADTDPVIIAQKLANQERFLNNKLTAFGFGADELSGMGFKTKFEPVKEASKGGVMDLVSKKPAATEPAIDPGLAAELKRRGL